jgi:hypothetical protein
MKTQPSAHQRHIRGKALMHCYERNRLTAETPITARIRQCKLFTQDEGKMDSQSHFRICSCPINKSARPFHLRIRDSKRGRPGAIFSDAAGSTLPPHNLQPLFRVTPLFTQREQRRRKPENLIDNPEADNVRRGATDVRAE